MIYPLIKNQKTLHVLKADFSGSSRVKMEVNWDHGDVMHNGCLVHDRERRFSMRYLLWSGIRRRYGVYVFHHQSSLVYLCIMLVFRLIGLVGGRFVYDVHDLLLRPDSSGFYLRIRYLILEFMEKLVSLSNIKFITVSRGICDIISKKYGVPVELVYNVSYIDLVDKGESHNFKDAIVYFGQVNQKRLPLSFVDDAISSGFTLDIHGVFRGAEKGYLIEIERRVKSGYVRYMGGYKPDDLSFLNEYRVLVMPFHVDNLNLKFCMPNKLFQALSSRVLCLVSDELLEMMNLSEWFGGALAGIPRSGFEPSSLVESYDRIDWEVVFGAINMFSCESKENYMRALS